MSERSPSFSHEFALNALEIPVSKAISLREVVTEQAEINERIENPSPNILRFGIWDQEKLVGFIELTGPFRRTLEVGFWLGEEYQDKDYISEAVLALSGYAFDELGCEEVRAKAVETNGPSHRWLQEVGYQAEEAELLNRTPKANVRQMLSYTKDRDRELQARQVAALTWAYGRLNLSDFSRSQLRKLAGAIPEQAEKVGVKVVVPSSLDTPKNLTRIKKWLAGESPRDISRQEIVPSKTKKILNTDLNGGKISLAISGWLRRIGEQIELATVVTAVRAEYPDFFSDEDEDVLLPELSNYNQT